MSAVRKGFTLVEALVAVALTSVGVVAGVHATGQIVAAQARSQEAERLQILAISKYQELAATGDYLRSGEGSFESENLTGYTWSCETEPSGVEGATVVRVTVSTPGREPRSRTITGIVDEPVIPEEEETAPTP